MHRTPPPASEIKTNLLYFPTVNWQQTFNSLCRKNISAKLHRHHILLADGSTYKEEVRIIPNADALLTDIGAIVQNMYCIVGVDPYAAVPVYRLRREDGKIVANNDEHGARRRLLL